MKLRLKALIMVVSRVEAVEAAVEQLSPEIVAVITSQGIAGDVAVECQRLKDRVKFLYAIVDSPMEIQHSFGRFEHLFGLLEERGYPAKDVVLDATGGTTTMRLGTALAAISKGVRMVHQRVHMDLVDGEWIRDESKPIEIVPMENPLESTGLLREGQGVELFDRRDYGAAALIFADVALKVEGAERSHYYTGLTRLSEGYAAWDVADYGTALEKLSAARKELSTSFSDTTFAARAAKLSAVTSANLEFLGKVRGDLSLENVVDMLENARRRIEDQNRYDDGVARLYRCIEMLHQYNLYRKHGLKTKSLDWGRVSEKDKKVFLERTGSGRLPGDLDLMRSRVLDQVLEGKAAGLEENVFRDLLQQRNNSILAHGFEPISSASARNFLRYVDEAISRPQVAEKARHPRLK
ncbi:TIGR02710 family CRISPR-associated CARF protein [Rubrobacter indicoceani]|uniref:TIGR02710 family CRISPR-associated CARF protein n=1 Tax=Rubrobacter indicoceani TaxID=2051957 RepID=UPI000E5B406B|nr:TIGR02710 family CRISPR-associated CARF protein [Rubrobacter indicoceani]